MEIEVKYYAMLRDIAKKKIEVFDMPEGSIVDELLQRLIQKYGEKVKNFIYDNQGGHRDYFIYMINGVNIFSLKGYNTRLENGDTFFMLPPIGGG